MRQFRRLQCFLAVAEHLHFRRAAEALNLTQPALSQQIRELEAEVGVALFERDRRSVSLTVAGERLLPAARDALRLLDDAVADIRQIGTDADMTVKFAHLEYLQLPFLPPTLAALKKTDPDVRVELVPAHPNRIEGALTGHEIDIGVALLPGTNDDLVYRSLMSGDWMLAMAEDHPLADYDVVPLAALKDQPLIVFERTINPNLFERLVRTIKHAGVDPNIAFEVTQAASGPQYAAQGLGVFIHASYIFSEMPEGVVRRRLDGFGKLDLGLVWRAHGRTTAITKFLEAAKRVREHPKAAQ